jgi:hypothetical protein
MNHSSHGGFKKDEPNPGATTPKSQDTATPLLAFCRAELRKDQGIGPVRGLKAREQVDAAIEQWAESLVSIIEASDNPEASLLQAHLAIASKHKELESIAWQELEIRTLPSGNAHG